MPRRKWFIDPVVSRSTAILFQIKINGVGLVRPNFARQERKLGIAILVGNDGDGKAEGLAGYGQGGGQRGHGDAVPAGRDARTVTGLETVAAVREDGAHGERAVLALGG